MNHKFREECMATLVELENLSNSIEELAANQGVGPYQLRNTDGSLAMVPIVTAKANLQAALARTVD